MTTQALWKFTNGYMTAALRASIESSRKYLSDSYGLGDIALETRTQMQEDCQAFYAANEAAIEFFGAPGGGHAGGTFGKAGYDFWLTRCGHDAGFLDGTWPHPQAAQLAKAAQAFCNIDLYVGEGGRIYASEPADA